MCARYGFAPTLGPELWAQLEEAALAREAKLQQHLEHGLAEVPQGRETLLRKRVAARDPVNTSSVQNFIESTSFVL